MNFSRNNICAVAHSNYYYSNIRCHSILLAVNASNGNTTNDNEFDY
jgi:hypothetical protein